MTYEFKYLMSTLSYVATGQQIKKPEQDIDWYALCDIAEKFAVHPMYLYALGYCEYDFIPENVRNDMKNRVYKMMVTACSRKFNSLSILKRLNDIGVEAIVLKGFALDECYKYSDARISGDVDIFVGKEKEEQALGFLQNNGFIIEKRNNFQKESKATSKQCGLIEVHAMFYDELEQEIWFKGIDPITEDYVTVTKDGIDYKTLGYTDNMIFITLHLIRHFIMSGLSIKQLLDVTLFYAKFNNKIDKDKFWSLMDDLQFKTLVNTVISTTVRYCGLPNEWMDLLTEDVSEDMEIALLDDLEKGGYLGFDNKNERLDGKNLYSQYKGKQGNNGIKEIIYKFRRFFAYSVPALFPSAEELKEKFSYAKKHSWLLPIAWLHRFFVFGTKRLIKGEIKAGVLINEDNISEAGKERMDVFKKMKML